MDDLARQAAMSRGTEQLRGLIDFARDVLKSVTLINGGAAIALLAFAANILSNSGSSSNVSTDCLIAALGAFTIGVFCAGVGSVTGYFTQYFYYAVSVRAMPEKKPLRLHIWTLRFVALSFISFIGGVVLSIFAFSS